MNDEMIPSLSARIDEIMTKLADLVNQLDMIQEDFGMFQANRVAWVIMKTIKGVLEKENDDEEEAL